jgi:alpha-D-ribose 1-methylphosphonate 5-triphosphate synthase subunit PhnL
MNVEYMSIEQFFECKSKLIGKIATYDLLIEGMEKAILSATLSGEYAEYEMDDGQMKVRSRFRSLDQMIAGMQGLRKIRQDYINQYNGRGTRLVGGSL